jgi:hypothetical protein
MLDDALIQRTAYRSASEAAEAGQPGSAAGHGHCGPRGTQPDIHGVDNGPRRSGKASGQFEAVPERQRRGNLVGLLGTEHVAAPASEPVQLGAHIEQQVARFAHIGPGPVDELAGRQRIQQLHIAQPAVAVLEIGFNPVRDVTAALPTLLR